jgi:ribokinase
MASDTAGRVVVVGSANMDLVGRAPRLPGAGETVIGGEFSMHPGGKGANQAVAAARLGAPTFFVGCVGNDSFGESLIASLQASGVDTTRMRIAESASTGIALIGVDEITGENSIIVLPGANGELSVADIEAAAEVIVTAAVLVCSIEAPWAAISAALELAASHGVTTILNPAPALAIPPASLRQISILTPNEHEVGIMAGDRAAVPIDAARKLVALGAGCVIVTLGPQGSVIVDGPESPATEIRAAKVELVVDTTAAGDCFTGALAVALSEGKTLLEAVAFASASAAISVTRPGAQASLPWRAEVDEKIGSEPRSRQ